MDPILRSGSIALPDPVSITVDDEIIWSSDTGRTLSGQMVGDVIDEKKNISINWGLLMEGELVTIKQCLTAGFFPFTFHDDGMELTIESYRGTLNKEQIGLLDDGIFWYRKASVSIIQR